jgi:hypothetical protein
MIERNDEGGFTVAAEMLAEALLLPPAEVSGLLRSRAITTQSEEGVGDDEGRWRLSFSHGRRRLRLVVDGAGTLISRSVVDFGQP